MVICNAGSVAVRSMQSENLHLFTLYFGNDTYTGRSYVPERLGVRR